MQQTQWTRCPQCGLVAEVVDRDVWPSTDGPVEHVHVVCVVRHRFVLPAAVLAQYLGAAEPRRPGAPARWHRTGPGRSYRPGPP